MAKNIDNKIHSYASTEETLAAFQPLCLSKNDRTKESLINITAFGAIYDGRGGLGIRDQYWLSHSLHFCKSREIAVLQDFQYTPINRQIKQWLWHDFTGPDFFDPYVQAQTPTDILICGYVLNPMAKQGRELARKEQAELGQSDVPPEEQEILGQISPLHTQTSCVEALAGYRPKVVFVFSRCAAEIQGKQFASPEYLPISSKTVSAPDFTMGIDIHFDVWRPLNPRWPLIINGHRRYKMDVLMQKDFAEQNGFRRKGMLSALGL